MSDLIDRLVKHSNCIGPCCENKRELLEAAERIAALEAQELGFVATIAELEAQLESAHDWKAENATAYDELNDAFIDLNLDCDNLRQQAARMPVVFGYVTRDAIPEVDKRGLCWVNISKYERESFCNPVYIDPPEEKGNG